MSNERVSYVSLKKKKNPLILARVPLSVEKTLSRVLSLFPFSSLRASS